MGSTTLVIYEEHTLIIYKPRNTPEWKVQVMKDYKVLKEVGVFESLRSAKSNGKTAVKALIENKNMTTKT